MMGCFPYFGLRLKAATLGLAVQNILSDKDLVMLLVTCVSCFWAGFLHRRGSCSYELKREIESQLNYGAQSVNMKIPQVILLVFLLHEEFG